VFPDYGDGDRCKITTPPLLESDRLTYAQLVVESPSGETRASRMGPGAYLQLIAATNYKQRLRKTTEYYHADRLGYAVIGTPNRLEYELGFFVKQGDGAADLKPIAHLYKTQVYALAEHLGVPEEVRRQPPTTDTFSLPQTQEEFYFALPYDKMDLCLYASNNGIAAAEVAEALELTPEEVARVYRDIEAKRRVARHLHAPPLVPEPLAD
jgi:NAD+ synthase